MGANRSSSFCWTMMSSKSWQVCLVSECMNSPTSMVLPPVTMIREKRTATLLSVRPGRVYGLTKNNRLTRATKGMAEPSLQQ